MKSIFQTCCRKYHNFKFFEDAVLRDIISVGYIFSGVSVPVLACPINKGPFECPSGRPGLMYGGWSGELGWNLLLGWR